MPVKYVGRTTDFCGKTLWEIVGNLKNFGVGRLVKRHVFDSRYQEPCFFRIVKVEPVQNEDSRKVRVWAEKVFRGQRYPSLVQIYRVSYKADYRLVPKVDEKELWDRVAATPPRMKIIPDAISFPPLLKYFIEEEALSKGEAVAEQPKLKLKVRHSKDNFYRKAEQGETPAQFPEPPLSPHLYAP